MPDWGHCQSTQYYKGMRVVGNSHCPDHHWLRCNVVGSHYNCEINYLLEYAMGHHPGREGYFTPLDEGELLSVYWDLFILLQSGPVKCTTHDMEHAPSKEERRWESSSVTSYLQSISSCLTVLLSLASMHSIISNSCQGQVDMYLFSGGMITWLVSLFSRSAWRMF